MHVIVVAVGGAVGATLRYGVAFVIAELVGGTFPGGTLFVNVSGSLLLGFAAGISELIPVSANVRLLVMTGFLGAFTTYSTFSLDTIQLFRSGNGWAAVVNLCATVFLGLGAGLLGLVLSRFAVGTS